MSHPGAYSAADEAGGSSRYRRASGHLTPRPADNARNIAVLWQCPPLVGRAGAGKDDQLCSRRAGSGIVETSAGPGVEQCPVGLCPPHLRPGSVAGIQLHRRPVGRRTVADVQTLAQRLHRAVGLYGPRLRVAAVTAVDLHRRAVRAAPPGLLDAAAPPAGVGVPPGPAGTLPPAVGPPAAGTPPPVPPCHTSITAAKAMETARKASAPGMSHPVDDVRSGITPT